jgi:murein DD-endopeptidase MepM/ murein hydrolase activator NlpD
LDNSSIIILLGGNMPSTVYVGTKIRRFFSIIYESNVDPARKIALEALWKRFNRFDPSTGRTYSILYRPTNRKLEMHVDYRMPPESPPGRYRVEVFIPGRHATTRRAIFSIAHNFRIENNVEVHDDKVSVVDMYHLYDVWFPLAELDFDPGANPQSGRVRQYELSLEDPPAEITFGPIRWVPLFTTDGDDMPRFDAPIGTQAEREGPLTENQYMYGVFPIWLGSWYDANPYLSWYSYGYHTGADLNLPGGSAADKDAPLYAAGDGTVTFAGPAGSWGNIIVIEHPDALVTLPNGQVQRQKVYTRYGHVSNTILVSPGQAVSRGDNIGFVGLPKDAVTGWHLHFDVSHSDKLKQRPAHWPDLSVIRALQNAGVSINSSEFREAQLNVKREVVAHYVDPYQFIKDNHGM